MSLAGTSSFLYCLLPLLVQAHISDMIRFENDLGDLVKPKQPLEASRDGRFIRFDTKDSEVELELGVSVPFLKIPTFLGEGGHHITINIAGLLVGAAILLTSFLLIPLVLPEHQGYGRSDEHHPNGAWSIINEVDQMLKNNNLDLKECSKKMVCEVVQSATNSAGDLLVDSVTRMNPLKQALEWSNMVEAADAGRRGQCAASYPSCFLQLSLLPRLFT